MSINATITKLRKNELIADIAKMSVTQLMEKRSELRHIRLNAPSEQQLDKVALADVTMEISRELTRRSEAADKAAGIDPAAESAKLIADSKLARENDVLKRAQRRLETAQQQFDNMTPQQRAQHLVMEDKPNPHSLSVKDFVATE